MSTLKTDIVIVGGGVAGLWMLNSLSKRGFDVILLEADTLGGGQSVRSQGIIHGGIKYALNGVLSQASDAIKEMPDRWKKCLAGTGELDLTGVKQLSDAHYLWSQRSLGSKITSFFAKKAMSGRVDSVAKKDYPALFNHPDFKGNLYKLNEIVLDVPSLMTKLADSYASRILKVDTKHGRWEKDAGGNIRAFHYQEADDKQAASLSAQHFIFAAGEGNGQILADLNIDSPQMQLRPLHMTMLTHETDLSIYAHCIGASSKPLATITHHSNDDGTVTWYFGGDIAETGLERDSAEQIAKTQALTAKILPWITLKNPVWSTLRINRAEPKQSSLARPDCAFVQSENNYSTCWPTKLALTPNLSDQVIESLAALKITPSHQLSEQDLQAFTHPAVSATAWSPS